MIFNDKIIELLYIIHNNNNKIVYINFIFKKCDYSYVFCRDTIFKLKEQELIYFKRHGRILKISLTPKAEKIIKKIDEICYIIENEK